MEPFFCVSLPYPFYPVIHKQGINSRYTDGGCCCRSIFSISMVAAHSWDCRFFWCGGFAVEDNGKGASIIRHHPSGDCRASHLGEGVTLPFPMTNTENTRHYQRSQTVPFSIFFFIFPLPICPSRYFTWWQSTKGNIVVCTDLGKILTHNWGFVSVLMTY